MDSFGTSREISQDFLHDHWMAPFIFSVFEQTDFMWDDFCLSSAVAAISALFTQGVEG